MDAKQSWKIGLLLVSVFSTTATGQDSEPIKFTIVTYDAARVGHKTFDQAERLAATVLRSAGTQPVWEPGDLRELQNLGMDFTAYASKDCQADPSSTDRKSVV